MIVMVMGVTGSGKTTIGSLLAKQLGWLFMDADEFHPAANVEKMRRGIPLDDADRQPWLQSIHEALVGWTTEERNVVIACSALKCSYRRQLSEGLEVRLVYLKGPYDLIAERVGHRSGHYAKADLVASQFAALEEPHDAIVVDIAQSPEEIVRNIRKQLDLA
jgi:gluconokinase